MTDRSTRGLSRRRLLGAAGAGAVAVGAAGAGGFAWGSDHAQSGAAPPAYPFAGAHQAGITTPAQDRLHFAAFDVTTDSREDLVSLLRRLDAGGAGADRGRAGGRRDGDLLRRATARHR